jgi:hypothetical protein
MSEADVSGPADAVADADAVSAADANSDADAAAGSARPIASARRHELVVAGFVFAVLLALGAALGLIWRAVSPTQPPGYVYPPALPYTETKAWIEADGRFAIMTAVLGLVVGVGAWFLRRARGPFVALALGAGGLLGALVTGVVGRAVGGGSDSGATHTVVRRLPLEVRIHGLYFIEAAVAVLAYGLLVAFAAADDLGRPDGRPDRAGGPVSVAAGRQPYPGRGDGDGPGPAQEHDLAPQ